MRRFVFSVTRSVPQLEASGLAARQAGDAGSFSTRSLLSEAGRRRTLPFAASQQPRPRPAPFQTSGSALADALVDAYADSQLLRWVLAANNDRAQDLEDLSVRFAEDNMRSISVQAEEALALRLRCIEAADLLRPRPSPAFARSIDEFYAEADAGVEAWLMRTEVEMEDDLCGTLSGEAPNEGGPGSRAAVHVDPRSEPRPETRPETRPEPRAGHRVDHRADHRVSHRAETRAGPHAGPHAGPRPDAGPDTGPDAGPGPEGFGSGSTTAPSPGSAGAGSAEPSLGGHYSRPSRSEESGTIKQASILDEIPPGREARGPGLADSAHQAQGGHTHYPIPRRPAARAENALFSPIQHIPPIARPGAPAAHPLTPPAPFHSISELVALAGAALAEEQVEDLDDTVHAVSSRLPGFLARLEASLAEPQAEANLAAAGCPDALLVLCAACMCWIATSAPPSSFLPVATHLASASRKSLQPLAAGAQKGELSVNPGPLAARNLSALELLIELAGAIAQGKGNATLLIPLLEVVGDILAALLRGGTGAQGLSDLRQGLLYVAYSPVLVQRSCPGRLREVMMRCLRPFSPAEG